MEINFRFFELTEQETEAAKLVEKFKTLIPTWVRELDVSRYEGEEDQGEAQVLVNRTYRYVEIKLHNKFFNRLPKERLQIFLHELIHAQHSEFSDWVDKYLIDSLQEKDPEKYSYFKEEARQRIEGFIQDLSYSIMDFKLENN